MADVNLNLSDSLNILSGHWIKIIESDGTSHNVGVESGLKLLNESPIPRTDNSITLIKNDSAYDVIPVFDTEQSAVQVNILTTDTLNVILQENVPDIVVFIHTSDSLGVLLFDRIVQGDVPFVINNIEGWKFKKANRDWVLEKELHDWNSVSEEYGWFFPEEISHWKSRQELTDWLFKTEQTDWKFKDAPNVWVLKKRDFKWQK